jgi:hypothetical protein
MKNGFKVFDTDTHVLPAAEVIERYVDPDFRPRLKELEPYRTPMRQSAEYQGALHGYRIQPQFYRRVLGEAAPRPDHSGRDTVWMGAKVPRPGVQDDNAANRVADMDDEGTDVHFLVPGGWSSLIGVDDVSLETGMIRAFHRHMADFCGQYPDRLKGPIVASTRDVLMYASDYPHSECQFPNSIDNILAWQSLKPQTQQKLLWDNANRFYRQT